MSSEESEIDVSPKRDDDRTSVSSIVGRIARALGGELSPGDVAALRRLDPASGLSPAFFRVVAEIIEPATSLPADGPWRDAAERRWAAVTRVLAILAGLHAPRARLGEALAAAGYTELRFERLLRAHDEALWDEARRAAHYLASKGQPADHAGFAQIILSDGAPHGEATRRRLARQFYGALRRASHSS